MSIKEWVLAAIRRVLSLFVGKLFPQVKVVRIEGGLGSQILGYLRYLEECRVADARAMRPPIVDTSYFDVNPEKWNRDVSLWSWQLDEFGITRNKLKASTSLFQRIMRMHPSARSLDWAQGKGLVSLGKIYRNSFPASHDFAMRILKALRIEPSDSEYCVVHLRRGDYLRVASLLLSEGEIFHLLNLIQNQIPEYTIFVSDSLISDELRDQFQNILDGKTKCVFLDDGAFQAIEIHNLMRYASLLIASNSTFSITAGVFNEVNGIVYAPLNFTRKEALDSPDAFFRSCGSFLVMT